MVSGLVTPATPYANGKRTTQSLPEKETGKPDPQDQDVIKSNKEVMNLHYEREAEAVSLYQQKT